MKNLILSFGIGLGAFTGCDTQPEPTPANKVAPAAAVAAPQAAVDANADGTPLFDVDYEEKAEAEISSKNYAAELDKLAAEIDAAE